MVISNNLIKQTFELKKVIPINASIVNASFTQKTSRHVGSILIGWHKRNGAGVDKQVKKLMFVRKNVMVPTNHPRHLNSMNTYPVENILMKFGASVTSSVHAYENDSINQNSDCLAIMVTPGLERARR